MEKRKNSLYGYDYLSVTTHYLQIKFSPTDCLLATASGFMYEYENVFYLITNAHNITRVNPENNKRISNHAGFPDVIETICSIKHPTDENYELRSGSNFAIDLYHNKDLTDPTWYMHPTHGYKVDVIAIPVVAKEKLPAHVLLKSITKFDFQNNDFPPQISDDVFVLGYPLNIVDKLQFPIWKRGSIATEPMLDIDNLPKLLIDTATRSGMSGSLVIYQRDGLHKKNPDKKEMGMDDVLGRIRGFLGIYSGRIGAEDNFQAQLGIVWKHTVVEEILSAKIKGTLDFQKL